MVLVVEDDPINQKLLADICKAEGYAVVTADDGEGALSIFHSRPLDLVLVDVAMPRRDGFAVCEEIRAESDVPVIILTASAEASMRERARQVGATGFVTKPFRIYELTRHMRDALQASHVPSEPPTGTGRRQRRCMAAAVLTSVPGPVNLRLRLRRESDRLGEGRACLIVRLENEEQITQRAGRVATDAVLGSLSELLITELSSNDVFWAESNELVGLMAEAKLDEMLTKLGALRERQRLAPLDVGEVALRVGAVRYAPTVDLDVDAVLHAARAAVDRANREQNLVAVDALALTEPTSGKGPRSE